MTTTDTRCRACFTQRPLDDLLVVKPVDGLPAWYICRPGRFTSSDPAKWCFRYGVPSRARATISLAVPAEPWVVRRGTVAEPAASQGVAA